jgi:tetratricopeptide (TPR) repeat protein
VQEEAAKRQQGREATAKISELFKPIEELQSQGKPKEALAELDKLEAAHPELASRTGTLRFKLLLVYDEPAACVQARQLLNGPLKDNSGALYMMGRDLLDPPARQHTDWDVALAIARRAADLRKNEDPSTLSVLAQAYYRKGDFAKAIETGELAVKKAEADPSFPAGSRTYIKRSLESYRIAQSKAAATK